MDIVTFGEGDIVTVEAPAYNKEYVGNTWELIPDGATVSAQRADGSSMSLPVMGDGLQQ
jgi:hypothetical protein